MSRYYVSYLFIYIYSLCALLWPRSRFLLKINETPLNCGDMLSMLIMLVDAVTPFSKQAISYVLRTCIPSVNGKYNVLY